MLRWPNAPSCVGDALAVSGRITLVIFPPCRTIGAGERLGQGWNPARTGSAPDADGERPTFVAGKGGNGLSRDAVPCPLTMVLPNAPIRRPLESGCYTNHSCST